MMFTKHEYETLQRELAEALEVATRNAQDCSHLRQSAIALTERAESAEAALEDEKVSHGVTIDQRNKAERALGEARARVKELEAAIRTYNETALQPLRDRVSELEREHERRLELTATLAQRDEALVKFLDNSAAEYSVRMHECGPEDREAFQQYNGHRQAFLCVKRMLPHLNAPAPERSWPPPPRPEHVARILADPDCEPPPEPAPKAEAVGIRASVLALADGWERAYQAGTDIHAKEYVRQLRTQIDGYPKDALPDAAKQVVGELLAQWQRSESEHEALAIKAETLGIRAPESRSYAAVYSCCASDLRQAIKRSSTLSAALGAK